MQSTNRRNKNFLEPAEFFKETIVCLKNDVISEKLGGMFILFAERLANHRYFVRYRHIRPDIVSCIVLACVKGFSKFRPYRNILVRDEEGNIISTTKVEWDGEIIDYDYTKCYNPFAYFSTCAMNDVFHMLKSEYNQRNIVNKLKLTMGLDADEGYLQAMRELGMASSDEDGQDFVIPENLEDPENDAVREEPEREEFDEGIDNR